MPEYRFTGLTSTVDVTIYAAGPTGGPTGSVLATVETDASGAVTVTLPDGKYIAEDRAGGMTHRTAGVRTIGQTLTADADPAAQAVDTQTVVGEVPFTGTVTRVAYLPTAAITGADTDSRTVTLTNRGAAGAGTTAVASLAFEDETDASDSDATAITLSATAEDREVTAGGVLTWDSTAVGDGLVDPGGQVVVEITR